MSGDDIAIAGHQLQISPTERWRLLLECSGSKHREGLAAAGPCPRRLVPSRFAGGGGAAPFRCPASPPKVQDLNYPSITVVNLTSSATVRRTVKNVGKPGVYKAYVTSPAGVRVTVSPDTLPFLLKGEKKTFQVGFEVTNASLAMDYSFGALVWTNGKQFVRSPLVVKTTTPTMA